MKRALLAIAVVASTATACDLIAGLGPPLTFGPTPDASRDGPAAGDESDAGFEALGVPDAPSDGSTFADPDGGLPFASCFDVQRRVQGADSGVYSVLFGDAAVPVFCDMTLDNGGWTAFFVGRVGKDNVFALFEDAASPTDCPDPATECLRRLPQAVSRSNDFAVVCGDDAIRFTIDQDALSYFQGGAQLVQTWQALTGQATIAGDASTNLAQVLGIKGGWIVSNGSVAEPTAVFASSYSINTNYDYCDGVRYVNAGSNAPRVELLFR